MWVGAALLYVIVSIREVTDPRIDQVIRDTLVAIRFPAYYAMGVTLLGVALVGAAGTIGSCVVCWRARLVAMLFLVLALCVLVGDYLLIYQPLLAEVTPPGRPRTERFQELHHWSEMVNAASWLLSLCGALSIAWPSRPPGEKACPPATGVSSV